MRRRRAARTPAGGTSHEPRGTTNIHSGECGRLFERSKLPLRDIPRIHQGRRTYPFAIPAILGRVVTSLEAGLSIEDLNNRDWFDLSRWRITY